MIWADPLLAVQILGVVVDVCANAEGWDTVAVAVAGQAPEPVTVTVYVFAPRAMTVSVVCPVLVQVYEYGDPFPVTIAVAVPSLPPLHDTGVVLVLTEMTFIVLVILPGALQGPPLTVKVTL
jgi:hypothetical protein